jgi:hypothetical protein
VPVVAVAVDAVLAEVPGAEVAEPDVDPDAVVGASVAAALVAVFAADVVGPAVVAVVAADLVLDEQAAASSPSAITPDANRFEPLIDLPPFVRPQALQMPSPITGTPSLTGSN